MRHHSGDRAEPIPVIGFENTGKSQLLSTLTGTPGSSGNYRGATVACDTYEWGERTLVDTPGIFRSSDTETTRLALRELRRSETVVMVVSATDPDSQLRGLLPLAGARRGVAVITFFDRVPRRREALGELAAVEHRIGVPVIPVDARRLSVSDSDAIERGLDADRRFRRDAVLPRVDLGVRVPRSVLERARVGAVLALLMLLAPAVAAVWVANAFAGLVEPAVAGLTEPLLGLGLWQGRADVVAEIVAGDFGLLRMGPLLFVWAVPTVFAFALLLGLYKASGLLDRISAALHPLLLPFGLTGRYLTRVVMGLGCNVPAVVCSRACSSCSRPATVSAIALGAACSYQLGATLAVFAAAGRHLLVVPYLLALAVSSLVYLRFTAPRQARSPLNVLPQSRNVFLTWPSPGSIWREMRGVVIEFFRKAVPIFLLITVIASVVHHAGIITAAADAIGPALAVFRLPTEAALPVVLSAVRKDGLLLFSEPLLLESLSGLQLLTGVFLGSVFLPCLVTAYTIAREMGWPFAGRLLARQMTAAVLFTLALSWGVTIVGGALSLAARGP